MKWVTWENVGVDRIGSAWLIRKYIDKDAEFVFVRVGSAPLPADGEAFDIPGARLSHHGGHCTFYTLLREYRLTDDPILNRIAAMIDEADLAQEVTLEPIAAGLDFLCRGLRLISPDDYIAIERGRLIYDALYAQIAHENQLATNKSL